MLSYNPHTLEGGSNAISKITLQLPPSLGTCASQGLGTRWHKQTLEFTTVMRPTQLVTLQCCSTGHHMPQQAPCQRDTTSYAQLNSGGGRTVCFIDRIKSCGGLFQLCAGDCSKCTTEIATGVLPHKGCPNHWPVAFSSGSSCTTTSGTETGRWLLTPNFRVLKGWP